uniref:Uncharacterized protein n=1 Tax=Thermofilum pendens TaxID=2269 RepID=A0A7C1T0X8_THEPE
MIAAAENLNAWLQLSEPLMVAFLVLMIYISINMGISLGLLFLYMFSARRWSEQTTKPSTAESEFSSMLESIKSLKDEISSVKEALSGVDLKPVLEQLSSIESRVSALESRTVILERRLAKPAEAPAVPRILERKPPEAAVPTISKLSDISLTFPEVKYAGIITSQGYVVESYGVCSEEPAKLLEIVRMYSTNSASIVRGGSRIEIFYIGEVKDLSNYGILEFADGTEVSEDVVDRAKKAISRYFVSAIASR